MENSFMWTLPGAIRLNLKNCKNKKLFSFRSLSEIIIAKNNFGKERPS